MFGDTIFSSMGIGYPSWYLRVRESKMMFGIIGWLVGNMAVQSLTQTGAFEIFVNDQIVFSKLVTNQMPTADIVLDAINRAL